MSSAKIWLELNEKLTELDLDLIRLNANPLRKLKILLELTEIRG